MYFCILVTTLPAKNPIFKFLDRQAPLPLVPNEYILDSLMAHVRNMQFKNAGYGRLLTREPPNVFNIPVDNSFIKLIGPNYAYSVKSRSGVKNSGNIFFDFIDKRTKMNRLFEIMNKTDDLNSTTLLKNGRIIDGNQVSKRAGPYMLRDKSSFKNPIQMIVPLGSPGLEIMRTRLSKPSQETGDTAFIQDRNPLQIPFNKMNRLDRLIYQTVPNEPTSMDVVSVWRSYLSPEICEGRTAGTKLIYPLDSRKFIVCQANDSYDLLDCPDGLIFDESVGQCDYA